MSKIFRSTESSKLSAARVNRQSIDRTRLETGRGLRELAHRSSGSRGSTVLASGTRRAHRGGRVERPRLTPVFPQLSPHPLTTRKGMNAPAHYIPRPG
jgi:hypothetical protein